MRTSCALSLLVNFCPKNGEAKHGWQTRGVMPGVLRWSGRWGRREDRAPAAKSTQPNVPQPVPQAGRERPPNGDVDAPAAPAASAPHMSASSEAQDDTCNLIASLDEVRRSYSSKPSGLVVHLLGARNVPRLLQLNRTSLTPYVRLWVIDHDGSARDGRVATSRCGTARGTCDCPR